RISAFAFDAVAIFAAWRYVHLRNINIEKNWIASRTSVFLGVGFATIVLVILPRLNAFALSTLSFCWMVLVHENATDEVSVFLRRFVPALAVLQTLHAYPVAGSQIALSYFLLVVVGTILISDGATGMRRALGKQGLVSLGPTYAVTGLTVLLAVGIFA